MKCSRTSFKGNASNAMQYKPAPNAGVGPSQSNKEAAALEDN